MRARARAVVEAGGVLRELASQPPLTLRRLHDAERDHCALGLVGSAAGPLDGDDLALDVIARTDARMSLVAAGATIALGRRAERARLTTTVDAAEGAVVRGEPGALIVSSGADLAVDLRIRMAASATVEWTETVVLGRWCEGSGWVQLAWDVERAGHAVLRQVTDLGQARLRAWPGSVGRARVLATQLRIGPDVAARTFAASATAAVHALAADAELITVLAPDTMAAQRQLRVLTDVSASAPR